MKLTLILSAAVLAVSLQPANAADKLRIATEGAYAPWNGGVALTEFGMR